ncbi:putative fog: Zn-finger [Gigaspora margarita]|uniref:Putative fog: Zn-finger n=1 Tax=Gigaspora margarita TaxID=4874 RepID=A0A8H4A3G1_GIGMA|nr:putative fog: Zn-finger [Gigaspora margarita]
MVSLQRFPDMQDLNDPSNLQLDYRQDICSISNVPPISILHHHHSTPSYHHQKEVEMASDYCLNMNNRMSFTEYLDEHYIPDPYEFYHPQHTTTCSSPESDSYSMFMEEPKIKVEFPESLDPSCSIYNVSRNIQDNCADLTVCNPSSITTPLTPLDSPHDQSPIMSPTGLSMSHHHIINEQRDIIPEAILINANNGRGRRGRIPTSSVSSVQEMFQDPQDFHRSIMGSLPSPPPAQPPTQPPTTTTKSTGKSRGRRMTNKPAKPGTKSFECHYTGCGRIFKRSEHLKRHIRSIHTLERPFCCPHPHCTKRFSRSDNLSQHIRVHRPNGKEKNAPARAFSNFTPYLQTYQASNVHTTLPQN